MSKYEWLLGVLKYIGLVIAFVSSLWDKVKVRGHLPRWKRRMPVILLCAGFLISLVASIFEDRANSQKDEARNRAELARTNRIILAGQTLSSLGWQWTFDTSEPRFQKLWKTGHSDYNAYANQIQGRDILVDEAADLNRSFFVDPFIRALFSAAEPDSTGNFLLLLPLDHNENAVLAIGSLDTTAMWNFNSYKVISKQNKSAQIGIRFKPDGPQYQSSGFIGVEQGGHQVYLERAGNQYRLKWELDPQTLINSINKLVPEVPLTANFPRELKMMLLFNIENLPFGSVNLAHPDAYSTWKENSLNESYLKKSIQAGTKNLFSHSNIRLTPNDQTDETIIYDFKNMHDHAIMNDDNDFYRTQCWLITFKRRE